MVEVSAANEAGKWLFSDVRLAVIRGARSKPDRLDEREITISRRCVGRVLDRREADCSDAVQPCFRINGRSLRTVRFPTKLRLRQRPPSNSSHHRRPGTDTTPRVWPKRAAFDQRNVVPERS